MTRTCPCGHTYDWHSAPIIGYMPDGEGGALELRNCPGCGSTRAEQVTDRHAASQWLRGRADALGGEADVYDSLADDLRGQAVELLIVADTLEAASV